MSSTKVRAVLLDIEGTVGPITFVRDVLFPYARQRYSEWLRQLPASERAEVRTRVGLEIAERDPDDDLVVATLTDWTDRDVKTPTLKWVQARIWHAGFAVGELRSDAYPDVEPALRDWRERGLSIYIYSSGAEQAQRDWFGHTEHGDLTPLLDGYFDLDSAGPKKEAGSYAGIAQSIGIASDSIVFFSDAADEVSAAIRAGMQAILIDRDSGDEIRNRI